ncbi:TrmH family RNA methyltransferase [Leptolyngbya sp. AN03gr2]|uniref:TrmH family RNA methyltransferase n=1 Tax=unclassified Leptolyngbya TaxID=2650499 RepID=UPI003D31709A
MLTSLQNPLVKQLRKLHRTKERREQQVFLLEGTHLIEEALSIDLSFLTVCCTETWQAQHQELFEQLPDRSERLELVSPEVLKAIATTVEPDGIVATIEQFHTRPVEFSQLGLVLETIQDPGNLGTIIRTAAAAGVEGLWLSEDCADIENPKVLRSSAGQWFRLPMSIRADLKKEIAIAKSQGMQVIATVPTATQTYWEIDFSQPSLILMGNEGAGLSPELLELADVQVTIPLAQGVESLNVAIATALMLYEARRQGTY